ncbi:MAG: hypothetical protein KJN60_11550 [Boseongicola sp.]|nr:hypothetical protein [Boseongicola sp.]
MGRRRIKGPVAPSAISHKRDELWIALGPIRLLLRESDLLAFNVSATERAAEKTNQFWQVAEAPRSETGYFRIGTK